MIKVCNNCGKTFDNKDYRVIFCSRSCATIFNNKKRGPLSDETKIKISLSLKNSDGNVFKKCKLCKKEFFGNKKQIFCSISCNTTYNNVLKGLSHSELVGITTKGKYKGDEVPSIYLLSKRTVRKILKRINLGCSRCGWSEGTCDIHHINGRKIEDPDNHNNLSLLCPNCHRLTHEGKIEKNSLITLRETLPDNWLDYYFG